MSESMCGICISYNKGFCEEYGLYVDFCKNQRCHDFYIPNEVIEIIAQHKEEITELISRGFE